MSSSRNSGASVLPVEGLQPVHQAIAGRILVRLARDGAADFLARSMAVGR
jgi:hypothetical protein